MVPDRLNMTVLDPTVFISSKTKKQLVEAEPFQQVSIPEQISNEEYKARIQQA